MPDPAPFNDPDPGALRPGMKWEFDFDVLKANTDAQVIELDTNILRPIFDWYFRTDPSTGEFMQSLGFVYPNNCTPKKLKPLMEWVHHVTRLMIFQEGLTFTIIKGYTASEQARLEVEAHQWFDRYNFYADQLNALVDAEEGGEEIMLGRPSSPSSERLSRHIIEPLFLGWYPNFKESILPFSEQGTPYSSQGAQRPPDLITPITLVNQFRVTRASYEESVKKFWPDFWEAAKEMAGKVVDSGAAAIMPILIPVAFGAAFLYGFTISTKGPGRTKL